MSLPRNRARWLAILAALAVLAAYWNQIGLEGDTEAMVRETRATLGCLSSGEWGSCRAAGQFPLLQKLPAVVPILAGASDRLTRRCLAILSFPAFLLMLRLGWSVLRKRSEVVARAYLWMLLGGPLLWYARSSFGEMLAALVTTGVVASCWRGGALLPIAGWSLAAAISKETAAPFLLLLGGSALLCRPRARRASPMEWGALAGGAVAGIVVNLAYNVFRFGGPVNQAYLDPVFQVRDPATFLGFFAGQWLSPNGGLLVFWPAFIAFLLLGSVPSRASEPALADDPDEARRPWLASVAAWGALAGLTLGFSRWYAPFGWIAWGTRLLYPWLPATALLVACAHATRIQARLEALARHPRGRAAIAALFALFLLPQFHALFSPALVKAIFEVGDPSCATGGAIDANAATYYRCIGAVIWPSRPGLLQAYLPASDPLAFALALGCAAVWAWGLACRWGDRNDRDERTLPA